MIEDENYVSKSWERLRQEEVNYKMIHTPAHKQTDPSKAPGVLNYRDIINHPNFVKASRHTDASKVLLLSMGLSSAEAYGWIKAWASGAGDGSE